MTTERLDSSSLHQEVNYLCFSHPPAEKYLSSSKGLLWSHMMGG